MALVDEWLTALLGGNNPLAMVPAASPIAPRGFPAPNQPTFAAPPPAAPAPVMPQSWTPGPGASATVGPRLPSGSAGVPPSPNEPSFAQRPPPPFYGLYPPKPLPTTEDVVEGLSLPPPPELPPTKVPTERIKPPTPSITGGGVDVGAGGQRLTQRPHYPTGKEGFTTTVPAPQPLDYYGKVRRLEGGTPNPLSTSSGPYGFTDPTFLDYIKANHPSFMHNLSQLDDPGQYHEAMTMLKERYGDDSIKWLTMKNTQGLAKANVPVNDTSLYLAHHFGVGGATKILSADPNASTDEVLGKDVVKANPGELSGKTVGQLKTEIANRVNTVGDIMPRPPTMPPVPQAGVGAAPDYSEVNKGLAGSAPPTSMPLDYSAARSALEQGRPTPPDQKAYNSLTTADVLAGLAKGAASVRADEPGSFARTLAAMGAGGMGGLAEATRAGIAGQEKYGEQKMSFARSQSELERDAVNSQGKINLDLAHYASQYAIDRAHIGMGQVGGEQDYNRYATRTAYENLLADYQHKIAVGKQDYDYQMEEAKLKMPEFKPMQNGVGITSIDPATGERKFQFIDTKTTYEKMGDLFKSMGMPPDLAYMYGLSATMKEIQNPYAADIAMKQMVARHSIEVGTAPSVFGANYQKAIAWATQSLNAEGINPYQYTSKPADWAKILHERALSRLLEMQGDDVSWIDRAANLGDTGAMAIVGHRHQVE